MIALVREQLDEIAELCARYHVRKLELFGSATGEEFKPDRSDVDFLVEFADVPAGGHFDSYFGLLEELEDLLGRHVDLVVSKAVKNPYFLEAVEPQREVVYAREMQEVLV